MEPTPLFWSKRGEVACERHVPSDGSERWLAEGWKVLPTVEGRRIVYQCQHCDRRAILHTKRTPAVEKPVLILNVDDHPAKLYARDRILRLHGFTVANAETGQSTLDVARHLMPNLILLDVHLPDVDGRDLCDQLKADELLGRIPVVLISSTLRSHAGPDEAIRRGNADGFLLEPVEPAMLASTLRTVLGSARRAG